MIKSAVVILCSISLIMLATFAQSVSAQSLNTICISSDGSVKGTGSIQRSGDRYTLTGDIFGTLTVQRGDIIFDGSGHIIKGDGNSTGIQLTSKNVTIINFHLSNHYSAISSLSDYNTISDNYITECAKGIAAEGNNATIQRNYIGNSDQAITLKGSYALVLKNNLAYNRLGIVFNNNKDFVRYSVVTENNAASNSLTILVTSPAANNQIYNNNFLGSKIQVNFQNIPSGVNVQNSWDNGKVGNYWSDYLTTYPNAKEVGTTGTGDIPYALTHSPVTPNMDNHPLMNPVTIPELPQGPQKPSSTPNENTWKNLAPMPTARSGLGLAVVNGKIYAIGGISYAATLSTNEMYDPATNTWTAMAPMPTARGYFATAVYENKIYCISGETGPGEMGSIKVTGANEAYDPATNTWEAKSPLPMPRDQMRAETINGKIYVIGGTKCLGIMQYQSFNSNDVYDPENDSWSTTSVIPVESWCYASAVLDNKIYVVDGGAQRGANLAYDPSTNVWASSTAIPSKFFSLGAAASSTTGTLAPKRIYVMGGTTGGIGAVSVNQAYNPYEDSWSTVAPMPTARYDLSIVNVNDTLYAIGGATGIASGPSGGWIPTNANEQYLPVGYGTPDPTYQTAPSTIPSDTPPLTQYAIPSTNPTIQPCQSPSLLPSAPGLPSNAPARQPTLTPSDVLAQGESQYIRHQMLMNSIYTAAAAIAMIAIAGVTVVYFKKTKK